MSQSNSRLNSVKIIQTRAYPLPPVHSCGSFGSQNAAATGSGRQKQRLGLGVNEQTGRVQWCPGMTCCKFLIILPVIMLPVTLVLILLMRMDGMLLALQQNQIPRDQGMQLQMHAPTYSDYYDNSFGADDPMDDVISEQVFPMTVSVQESELARIKRCMNYKFGLSEGIETEDRDILKDSSTSFLPKENNAIPRECLEPLKSLDSLLEATGIDDYIDEQQYRNHKKRPRRTPDAQNYYTTLNDSFANIEETGDSITEEAESDDTESDTLTRHENVNFLDSMTALQSFWNEQGTKETIRQTQAKTMLKYMDQKVDPCNDFYKFACGNWEKRHPIPRDKAGFDTFEMLRENLDYVLKQLLEAKDTHLDQSTNPQMVAPVPTQNDNSYESQKLPHSQADVVKTGVPKPVQVSGVPATAAAAPHGEVAMAKAPPATKQLKPNEQEEIIRLRRQIISRREALGRLLMRYKRQTTNTKRKRLVSIFNSNNNNNKDSLTNAGHKRTTTDAHLKARYLYQSCTNMNVLKKRGIQPLLKLIDDFGGWPVLNPQWNPNNFDWLNLTAHLRRYNNDIFIVQWVGPDIKNSDENVIQFDQTSLGLPTREYFLQEINAKYLQAYQRFMSEVIHKLGATKDMAEQTATELITFETQLASITAPADQRLNVTKLYSRMTLKQLHALVPEIDWMRYLSILQNRNVQDTEQVVIYATNYMRDLVSLLSATEPRTISNYLLWRFMRHRINNVDDRFEDSKQNFYHALFGREESPSRWKVCIAQVNTNMGMALGSMFVKKYFDENSKRDTLKMTHELQQAFRDILHSTDWIDPSTKHLAELKVNAMSLKIGYPDFILNPAELNEKYAGIEIQPDQYFENTLNVLLHTARTEQNKIHEPVNKTNWQTAPAIVNAYYSRNKNQIMFPAGILQPPFYHRDFPRALNFGGIGVVIGHELTHGFDDKGRLFDRNGSIHKWWTDESIKGFDERARCIIAQYSNYTVGEVGIALNGESTQGENIADNGGIRQAFHAYKRWLHDNPQAAVDERLPGINMTGEQLFFLNFGQVWCGAMRPEAVRNKLNTAIHSPGRFRVIGTLSNSYDFAREFHCPSGSPMNPAHKCSVW